MKRILLIILYLFVSLYCYSQHYSNVKEVAGRLNISEEQALEYLYVPEAVIMNYLRNNVSKLDPIEGFYDVHLERQHDGRDIGEEDLKLYIFKATDGNLYIHNGNRILSVLLVEKLGELNIYKFTYQDLSFRGEMISKSVRIPLDNTTFFDISFSFPDKELGGTLSTSLSWIKEYPKTDDYTSSSLSIENPKRANWCGTCFAISKDVLVTNNHIVENANAIEITGLNGNFTKRYSVSVIGSDKNNDLSLLRISDESFSGFSNIPYKIDFTSRDIDSPINIVGYPKSFSAREEIQIFSGMISSKNGYQGDATSYKISIPLQETCSGGPLMDADGNIIGIANFGVSAEDDVSYSVKSSCLQGLVEAILDNHYSATSNSLYGLSSQEQCEKIRPFVGMVLCSSQSVINLDGFKESPLANTNDVGPIPFIQGLRKVLVPSNEDYIIIENPEYYSARHLKVERIVMSDLMTIVDCYVNVSILMDWVAIKPSIKLVADKNEYALITAKGIALSPQRSYPPSGEFHFTLYFKPIPNTVTELSIIEPGGFNIKGIKVK